MKCIGLNRIGNFRIGNTTSSFNEKFTNEHDVYISNGIDDIIRCKIGNIDELYDVLNSRITGNESFEEKVRVVFNIVNNYFGTYENVDQRMDNYKSDDFIESEDEVGKVSDLKGKNAGMCVERAMVSQNLLKHLGINSFYKTSAIENNGKNEVHSYNLIENEDKYYIYDSTMPKSKNGEVTPLITEIPKEVFEEISKGEEEVGYPVEVEFYNPLRKMQKHIIYDSWKKERIYKANKQKDISDDEER